MELGNEVILLLVGTAGVVVGSLVTQVVGGLRESRARDEQRIDDLNREVSTALAMVRAVLDDALPDRTMLNAHPEHSRQQLDNLREQWQPARLALFAAADRHPDADVREAAQKLNLWTSNLLAQSTWLLRDVLQGKDLGHPMQRAQNDHDKATSWADKLSEHIRLQTDR